jgi:hypothetical protein
MLFCTIGDNDYLPTLVRQEIEKVRTDVKIVNTSLFMTVGIDQENENIRPITVSFTHDQYVGE